MLYRLKNNNYIKFNVVECLEKAKRKVYPILKITLLTHKFKFRINKKKNKKKFEEIFIELNINDFI